MRIVMALTLLSSFATPALAPAQDTGNQADAQRSIQARGPTAPSSSEGRLFATAVGEETRLAATAQPEWRQERAGVQKPKNWIQRHPALFGTLVGAGAGALASGTMETELFCSGGDEDCFFHGGSRVLVGAGMGAGVGALIGWLGSR